MDELQSGRDEADIVVDGRGKCRGDEQRQGNGAEEGVQERGWRGEDEAGQTTKALETERQRGGLQSQLREGRQQAGQHRLLQGWG